MIKDDQGAIQNALVVKAQYPTIPLIVIQMKKLLARVLY